MEEEEVWGRILGEWLSRMQPAGPEYLRATTAGRALFLGRAFIFRKERTHAADKADFRHSFRTKNITCFWSHSWRTRAWRKTALLLLWYNHLPANVVAALGGLATCVLCCCDLLPGNLRQPMMGPPGMVPMGAWCLCTATLLFYSVLFLWRSQASVWVDALCIHQSDKKLKAAGMLSLGACLSQSDSLLVLWDSSWIQRLWCVFELAAFLKRHGNHAGHRVAILPLFLLVMYINHLSVVAMMLASLITPSDAPLVTSLSSLCVVFILSFVVELLVFNYYRKLQDVTSQIQDFRLQRATCYCCDHNHPTDQPCDRLALVECIRLWFGSEEAFEQCVSSTVAGALKDKLGQFPVPIWLLLSSSAGWAWGFMDCIAAQVRVGEYLAASMIGLDTISWMFLYMPTGLTFSVWLIRIVQRSSCRHMWLLRWMMCRISFMLFNLAYVMIYKRWCHQVLGSFPQGSVLFFASCLVPALAAWHVRRRFAEW
ncbi:unnamed protein product [Effrenium voratum]|nr:unnamed protein product [Effrenium voratum]